MNFTQSEIDALRDTADVIDEACGPKMTGVVHVIGPTAERMLRAHYISVFRELAIKIEKITDPPGFTRKDVFLLRERAEVHRSLNPPGWSEKEINGLRDIATALDDLADRIEAQLPPPETP